MHDGTTRALEGNIPRVSTSRDIPSLDGLRAIAIFLVLVAHAGGQTKLATFAQHHHLGVLSPLVMLDCGDLGVSVFFVLSGYLITTLLVREYERTGTYSLTRFYIRRSFRIFPTYYVYLAVVGTLTLADRVHVPIGALWSSFAYVSNYYPYTLSRPDSMGWLVGHTWSLSLEEQFYLLSPAALLLLGRRLSLRVCCIVFALAPFSRILTMHLFPGLVFDSQILRMFHTRIDTILAGCILALLVANPVLRDRMRCVVNIPSTLVALAALLGAEVSLKSYGGRMFGVTIAALAMAWLLFTVTENPKSWTATVLNASWVKFIGVTSYSIYLWQQLFLGPNPLIHSHALALGLIVLVSQLSYWLVERPSFRVRDWVLMRFVRKAAAPRAQSQRLALAEGGSRGTPPA